MRPAPLLLLLAAAPAFGAQSLGGHEQPDRAVVLPAAPLEDRKATLEELRLRRVLAPDQGAWSPADRELLETIRRLEPAALEYLKEKFGGYRPWVAVTRVGGLPKSWLTKEGYQRYLGALTQDAIVYFEGKGADAKDVFKLVDWDGKRLFTPEGSITEAGVAVYRRAKLKLEVYWRGPDGRAYGTRRPPASGASTK